MRTWRVFRGIILNAQSSSATRVTAKRVESQAHKRLSLSGKNLTLARFERESKNVLIRFSLALYLTVHGISPYNDYA